MAKHKECELSVTEGASFQQVVEWLEALEVTATEAQIADYGTSREIEAWSSDLVMEHRDQIQAYVLTLNIAPPGELSIAEDGGILQSAQQEGGMETPETGGDYQPPQALFNTDDIVGGVKIARDRYVNDVSAKIQDLVDEIPDLISQRVNGSRVQSVGRNIALALFPS
jgi:hypothetical protein